MSSTLASPIRGMGFVPGVARGKLGRNPATPPKCVLLADHELLRDLSASPAACVLVNSAPFSHASISLVSRGIPTVVVGAEEASQLHEGLEVVLDGASGWVPIELSALLRHQKFVTCSRQSRTCISESDIGPAAGQHGSSSAPSGPCGKFCNAQSPAVGPRQGARRREWQALSKGCNTALAQQRGSLRAGARVPSPALRSLELALASPTLTCLVDETRESAEC